MMDLFGRGGVGLRLWVAMRRARPEDWWRVQRLGDGVSLIDEPHILPFYRCNCWHVRGRDRDMLVDSGMGWCVVAGLGPAGD